MGKVFKLSRDQEREAIGRLLHLGYQYHPAFPEAGNLADASPQSVRKLTFKDDEVRAMVAGHQTFLSRDFNRYAGEAHGRAGYPDGVIGPATHAHIMQERCEVPDFFPPGETAEILKTGTGNWKGCWGTTDFHHCRDKVDPRLMPEHVKRVWPAIVRAAQEAYAAVGLFWDPSEEWTQFNTALYFVSKSSGWIGLASVMNGRTCTESGFNSYANYYGRGQSDAWNTQHWAVLVLHEKGHNCGFQHTNGDIMNPSLRPGTKPTWIGDQLESSLRGKFGGVPYPLGGTTPPPVTPPPGGGGNSVTVSGNRLIVPANATPGTYDLSVSLAGSVPGSGGGGWEF